MVKEEKVYTTSDGKQYKTKKSAERHENMLTMENKGYTKKEVDGLLKEISVKNKRIEVMLDRYPDWRDMDEYLVKQLPKLIEDHKNDVATYQIIKETGWGRNKSEDIVERVRLPRLEDGELPESFVKRVDDLTEQAKEEDGSVYELVLHDTTDSIIKYRIGVCTLSPEDKMAEGYKLKESDIETLVWEREELYKEEGEDRRWSKVVTSVVQGNDGHQYAIHWDKGLTETQENSFWEQPQRVKLEERVITKTVTDIIYIDDEKGDNEKG